MNPQVSIIFVYFNTPKEIGEAVKSVRNAAKSVSYEIIIIDNDSPNPVPQEITKDKKIKLIKNKKNIGYSAAINLASTISRGRFFLFSNSDVVFTKNSIQNMYKRISNDSSCGVIGPQQTTSRGKVLQSYNSFPTLARALFVYSFLNKFFPNNPYSKKYWLSDMDTSHENEVDFVGGACFMVPQKVFAKIGELDERFFMYFEEIDLCKRVAEKGYTILYYPYAKVIHYVGKSTDDKELIERIFEQSRFEYFKKYNGFIKALLIESFLRITKSISFYLILIFLFSLFLNSYRLSDLMMFYGDFGRDFLAARDMILTQNFPLVGIPSSVVWLHQGPLSIYMIGLSFLFSNFHPITPAIFYGFLGAVSTVLIYFLGKGLFNRKVGILSSLFFATSPLIVVSGRMPYHTAPIPLFTILFFIVLSVFLQRNYSVFPFLLFLLGILLQLELSNGVLFFVLVALIFFYKIELKKIPWIKSFIGFVCGILPFILYDLSHTFVQTGGFLLWVINRVRLFFGFTLSGQSTTANIPNALYTTWLEIQRIVFPSSTVITVLLILLIHFVLIFKHARDSFYKRNNILIILCWIIIPLGGFIVHTSPGTAYFPVLFPAVSILVGYSFFMLSRLQKLFYLLFFFIVGGNIFLLFTNNFYMTTSDSKEIAKPNSFSLGYDLNLRQDIAEFIVKDASGNAFDIRGGGFLSTLATGVDNYEYLAWWLGGKIDSSSDLTYIIYENEKEIPKHATIAYKNKFILVLRDEID